MNTRRSFFNTILKAGIAAAILPAATTYARKWKPTNTGIWITNPEWENAPYEFDFHYYKVINIGPPPVSVPIIRVNAHLQIVPQLIKIYAP